MRADSAGATRCILSSVPSSAVALWQEGIRGYEYIRTDYHGGQTIFTIHQDPDDCLCSACGSRAVISRGHSQRPFLGLAIGSRKTTVVLPIPRVECRACGLVRQVKVPFAEPRRSHTKSFERYVLELSRRNRDIGSRRSRMRRR